MATAAACSSVIVGAMSAALVETRASMMGLSPPPIRRRAADQHHDDLGDRRLRPEGVISASTKTISFTGCRFDLAQLADAEAAGAFARRWLHLQHNMGTKQCTTAAQR